MKTITREGGTQPHSKEGSVKIHSAPSSRSLPTRQVGPIYDFKTTNKSFITTYHQLRMNGVENAAFHLVLLNPRLQGVDPHSKDLTPQQVMWIVQECSLNIFYYLREVVRIEEQGGGLIPFRMDRGTLAALYCFYNNINFYLMKPRQTGKTVGILAMLSWAFKFSGPNGDFMFSCYKEELSKKNLRGMKTILNNLPSYLSKMGTTKVDQQGKTIRKTDNIKTYREPAQNNSAMVANCANSEDAAETIGRGFTQIYQFFDEAEFTKYIATIVKVSGMSFNTASRNAAKNGSGYCRIFATTPGDLGNKKACGSAMEIVKDSVVWSEKFYDDLPLLRKLLAEQSELKVVYIEYDYKSLGYGEEWFVDACGNVGGDINKIKREILLQRFAGNSNSPFTNDEIEALDAGKLQPMAVKNIGKIYDILFYEKPKKQRLYFLSIDPSDGTGGDNYAITVMNPYELTVTAEFKSPYMTIHGCVDLVTWMVDNYFPNVLIIIERNRNGGAVVEMFKHSKLRDRIYSSPEANADNARIRDKLDENGFIKEEFVRNKYFGTNTTQSTRQVMMNILLDAVHFARHLVRSKYLVEDILDLVIKNDKIQAAPGKHDDCVMSWLLGLYIYYYGENLERYGFVKGELPKDVQEDDKFKEIKRLYANPEIKKQFPTLYAYYLQEMEREKAKERTKEDKKKPSEYKLGGLDDMFEKSEPVPDIDNLISDKPEPGVVDTATWRKSVVSKFMALNR